MTFRLGAVFLLVLALSPAPAAYAQGPATLYSRALARERGLRDESSKRSLKQMRALVATYEAIVRRHPASGYSDNALWQAANLSLLAYERFGQQADRRAAARLLAHLQEHYPASSLVGRADEVLRMAAAKPAATRESAATAPATAAPAPPAAVTAAVLKEIKRSPLADGTRVTIEIDTESAYRTESLENPRRVFFDLPGVRPVAALQDAALKYDDGVVREIRLGRHPNTTRVVMDMEGVDGYSVFTLYNPYRIVVDFKAAAPAQAQPPQVASLQAPPPAEPAPQSWARALPAKAAVAPEAPAQAKAIPSRPITAGPLTPPAVPAANSDGKFSLARQLGLGVARIVIDAGHGGHDPGAQANGIKEAELVLDVAQRLNKLALKQGFEVVMTRDSDVFIPLEERTAIANREGADLFLSIHANAARNTKARGVETYFLNFASNPEAEEVAARENSASGRTMHSLPDIVRAIALNNKLDESRDFAGMVQRAMVRRLATRNRQLKDLGVKQAPFVVLIGAQMPSVLAEISFVTHKQEGQLLKTAAYRQQIAEALLDAVLRYQQSLKKLKSVGAKAGT